MASWALVIDARYDTISTSWVSAWRWPSSAARSICGSTCVFRKETRPSGGAPPARGPRARSSFGDNLSASAPRGGEKNAPARAARRQRAVERARDFRVDGRAFAFLLLDVLDDLVDRAQEVVDVVAVAPAPSGGSSARGRPTGRTRLEAAPPGKFRRRFEHPSEKKKRAPRRARRRSATRSRRTRRRRRARPPGRRPCARGTRARRRRPRARWRPRRR